jgi:hypothetical protein
MTRGGFGARSDVTLIGAPMLNAGGEFEDPACAQRLDLSEAWDMPATGTVRGPHPDMVREALAVCSGCAHLIECGQHALDVGEPVGVWGGLTPDQRAALRRIAGKP